MGIVRTTITLKNGYDMLKAQDILLGAIQLEAMDLIINPREEKVEGAHGDQVMHLILSCQ